MLAKALCDIDQRGLTMEAGEEKDIDAKFTDLVGRGMIVVLKYDRPSPWKPRCVVEPDDAAQAEGGAQAEE